MKIKNRLFDYIIPFFLIACAVRIFAPWFSFFPINAGDWPYYATGMFKDFSIFAPLWTAQGGVGLGGVNADFPTFSYLFFTIGFFVNLLHIPWIVVYKVMWFGLPLALSCISITYLYKKIKIDAKLWELCLAGFLYIGNTYFLMISAGGQMGIVLAYSVTPLVIAIAMLSFSRIEQQIDSACIKSVISIGFIVAIQVLFDIRIAFLTICIVIFFIIYQWVTEKRFAGIKAMLMLILALLITTVLHSYWILPVYLFKLLAVAPGLTSSSSFSFFSFADFSHAFAFLHPNWPDNMFGKVYFLQPEFLLYPILAFTGISLLHVFPREVKRNYLFFSLVALLGIFLAKGVQNPFGQINIWIFNHLPGFNLFRDPTKYYLLIAIAYAMLIPMTLSAGTIKLKNNKLFSNAGLIITIFLICFTIRQAVFGQLQGTFKPQSAPQEYTQLADFLVNQHSFFRTLWVPDQSRFRFESENHPMMIAHDVSFAASNAAILQRLTPAALQQLSIKYIIVPDDTTKEIFVTDRVYDDHKRQQVIKDLDTFTWLHKSMIGNIVLYEVPDPRAHIYLKGEGIVSVTRKTSSDYTGTVATNMTQSLFFTEAYTQQWVLVKGKQIIKSTKTPEGLNSFSLPAGTYQFEILFAPEVYEKYFYMLSGILLGVMIVFLFVTKKRKKAV